MGFRSAFTDRRFDEGSEDYYVPLTIRGVRLPHDQIVWSLEIDCDLLAYPKDAGPLDMGPDGGEHLCQVLEKVIEVIRQ